MSLEWAFWIKWTLANFVISGVAYVVYRLFRIL